MRWKKQYLKNSKLYLILDAEVCDYHRLMGIVERVLRAGVDIIQLRDKKSNAREIYKACCSFLKIIKGKIPFIVNDRVDIAQAVGADGVHLGQNDLPIENARKMMGARAIIGVSCQNLKHLRVAQLRGADYIGFGSVFKTLTKPHRQPMALNLLKKAYQDTEIPIFAIGGIRIQDVRLLRIWGVDRIAVCRSVLQSTDPQKSVKEFKDLLRE